MPSLRGLAIRIAQRLVPPVPHLITPRHYWAYRLLEGEGIEIGALNSPLPVPPQAKVRYVDVMPLEKLRELFPELAGVDLVAPDILDEGETLATIADGSQDFVIANHMLEHTENPIGTLRTFLRVLKPGGKLYLAVPDKRYTFDLPRAVTPLEHLIRDDREGPAWSRHDHFRDAALSYASSPSEIEAWAREKEAADYRIHFHVWTQAEFLELLLHCRRVERMPFDILAIDKHGIEVIAVLGKHTPDDTF